MGFQQEEFLGGFPSVCGFSKPSGCGNSPDEIQGVVIPTGSKYPILLDEFRVGDDSHRMKISNSVGSIPVVVIPTG